MDGSPSSQAAVAFAAEEASLRGARLRAVLVWPPSLLAHDDVDEGLAERRRLPAESVAGRVERYPDAAVSQEVLRGQPVEQLALASLESLALIVGRRGRGGYSGTRLGATVHGLLHRAMCPVITVPFPQRGERPGDPAWADRSRTRATDRPRPVDPLGTGPPLPPRETVGREDAPGPSAGSPERWAPCGVSGSAPGPEGPAGRAPSICGPRPADRSRTEGAREPRRMSWHRCVASYRSRSWTARTWAGWEARTPPWGR
ncbi:universal stress protein [Streptomyces sp. NPDC093089]|uniref:universal stress protein n=1 Tax=Streptomyces sp. NPDC093089 TaxID=3366024 RepID=UPI003827207B